MDQLQNKNICGCGRQMGVTERAKDFILYSTFAGVIILLFMEIRATAKGKA
jgi:hypothetical protein